MNESEYPSRFPAKAAIDSLARRFQLPNSPLMQDWEWEVADPTRLSEFLAAYESKELTEDEQFVLMEIILQSTEDSHETFLGSLEWERILRLLETNIRMHISSIRYWADVEFGNADSGWRISPCMRRTLDKYAKHSVESGASHE